MKPTPKLWHGIWVVDLRALGLGQRRRLDVLSTATELEAVHAAYALIERLKGERAGVPQSTVPGAPLLFSGACDEFAKRKRYPTTGGRKWGTKYLKKVRDGLGSVPLVELAPPGGNDRLLAYRDVLRANVGPRTCANAQSLIRQVLAFAVERGWLPALPVFPDPCNEGETLFVPRFEWYTEAQFRQLRAGVFADATHIHGVARAERDGYVARRRLYLSFAFYTGMHTADLDGLRSDDVLTDFARYIRRNTKSARCVSVRPEPFEMPEQLALDCGAELGRLGRPWYPGERLCGGPWGSAVDVMQRTAARLGLPPVDLRRMRRSCARMYALLGWSERDVSELLGHVDQRMIREVYLRVPEERSPVKVPWTVENSALPWLAMRRPRRVVPFVQRVEGQEAT